MRRFLLVLTGFVISGLLVSASPILSHADDFSSVIKDRQAKLKELGGHMKAIGTALQSGQSDAATIKPHADAIAHLASDLPTWFPPGSGPEGGNDTQALSTIWEKPEAFQQAATNFQQESAKLVAISSSGNAEQIGAELKAVGGMCGGCHKQFRKPE